jgi:hypothetical protein
MGDDAALHVIDDKGRAERLHSDAQLFVPATAEVRLKTWLPSASQHRTQSH